MIFLVLVRYRMVKSNICRTELQDFFNSTMFLELILIFHKFCKSANF